MQRPCLWKRAVIMQWRPKVPKMVAMYTNSGVQWTANTYLTSGFFIFFPDAHTYGFVRIDDKDYLNYRNYYYEMCNSSKTDKSSYWRCRYPGCPSRARVLPDHTLAVTTFKHDHPKEEEGETVDIDIKEQVIIFIANSNGSRGGCNWVGWTAIMEGVFPIMFYRRRWQRRVSEGLLFYFLISSLVDEVFYIFVFVLVW